MGDIGDVLLFALSSMQRWSWEAFRRAFDDVRLGQGPVPGVHRFNAISRWRCARLLDSLGHCDLSFNQGRGHLIGAPAVLASLPIAGLPRAILCGSRSPQTVSVLAAAAGADRLARVNAESQRSVAFYAPTRIELETDDRAEMERFADAIGVALPKTPPAWSLALRAGEIDGYLERIPWTDDPEIGWVREDFDPSTLRFAAATTEPARLSRYQDPVRSTWTYRLVRDGKSAPIDPAWGRWASLKWASRSVLQYESTTGSLRVPVGLPIVASQEDGTT